MGRSAMMQRALFAFVRMAFKREFSIDSKFCGDLQFYGQKVLFPSVFVREIGKIAIFVNKNCYFLQFLSVEIRYRGR